MAWSGGIDSTALIAQLLKRGHSVVALVLGVYEKRFPKMWRREREAQEILVPVLRDCIQQGADFSVRVLPADWIWAFSTDGIEIPRRNKHIIDHIITQYLIPEKKSALGLGEYIGGDTWLVRDHVGAADADTRSLTAYIFQEYGLDYRLYTLNDFGEARYKHDRVRIGMEAIGDAMLLTTNCLYDFDVHCGKCYKCFERHAAFMLNHLEDSTTYLTHPSEEREKINLYLAQMRGTDLSIKYEHFKEKK